MRDRLYTRYVCDVQHYSNILECIHYIIYIYVVYIYIFSFILLIMLHVNILFAHLYSTYRDYSLYTKSIKTNLNFILLTFVSTITNISYNDISLTLFWGYIYYNFSQITTIFTRFDILRSGLVPFGSVFYAQWRTVL